MSDGVLGPWRGILATSLFEDLRRRGTPYVMLRDYDLLPEAVEHDVDIAVPPVNLSEFEMALLSVAEKHRCLVVRPTCRADYRCYVLIACQGVSGAILKVDVWTDFRWRGLRWFRIKEALRASIHRSNVTIASPQVTAYTRLVKEILHRGSIRSDHERRLDREVARAGIPLRGMLERLFGGRGAGRLWEHLVVRNWQGIALLAPELRRRFVCRTLATEPLDALRGVAHFAWSVLARVLSPSGRLVAFVGPDGSGKTSACNELSRLVAGQLFTGVRYVHGRFGLLPDLRNLRFKLALRNRAAPGMGVSGSGGDSAVVHPPLRAALMLLYYGLDYIMAWPRVMRWKAHGDLILADRYFYDYYFQPAWQRAPRWFIRLIERIVPTPDLVVHLRCEPETIHGRKPELACDEIRRQQLQIDRMMARIPRGVVVSSRDSIDLMVSDIIWALAKTFHLVDGGRNGHGQLGGNCAPPQAEARTLHKSGEAATHP